MLKKNLESLSKVNPELAEKILRVRISQDYKISGSKENFPVLTVRGLQLHSGYAPEKEAEKIVAAFEEKEKKIIHIFGFGLGYHVKEFLKEGKEIVIIEPSLEILNLAFESVDFSEWMDKLTFKSCEEPFQLGAQLGSEEAALFTHQVSKKIFNDYYDAFFRAYEGARSDIKLRIMVVGPIYGGSLATAGFVENTLKAMGHETEFVDCSLFADSFHKINLITSNKLHEGIIRTKYTNFLGETIIARAIDFSPDIILAMAQAPMSEKTISRLKQSEVPVAFWFVEDFRELTYWRELAHCYDYFFSIQKGEFQDLLSKQGVKNSYYLPQACYPSIHKELDLSADEKKYYGSDLSFVGAGYYNRQKFFQGLCDFNFKIWGSEWNTRSILAPHIQENSKRVDPEEYVKIFNSSPINLNLHSSTFHEGVNPNGDFVNPRTFEIAACGAFQLVDIRSELSSLFSVGDEIVQFENLTDLRDKISYYLARPDERKEISTKAKKRALKDHTFEKRLKVLLGIILAKDFARIGRKIEERKKKSSGINCIQNMLLQAGDDKELKNFLSRFKEESTLTLKEVMAVIEKSEGAITKPEAIFMMINEILKEGE